MKIFSFRFLFVIMAVAVDSQLSKNGPSRKRNKFTIIAGTLPPGPSGSPVISSQSAIYSDTSKIKVIGTFALSCTISTVPGIDVFDPCLLFFYFHPPGAIGQTKDTITASGIAIVGNLTDSSHQPVFQLFAVTGGTGAYIGATGQMSSVFSPLGLSIISVTLL